MNALWKRYVMALLVVPVGLSVGLFLMLLFTRIVGVCIISLNGIPTDLAQLERRCGDLPALSWVAVCLSQIFVFGGPLFIYLYLYPFYLAYPEIVTPKRRSNAVLYSAGVFMLVSCVAITLSVPVAYRTGVLGIARALLILYWMLLVPLRFRREIVDRERNVFLIQMEHDWACCDHQLDFRQDSISKMELTLYIMVVWLMISVVVFAFTRVDLILVIILPLAVLSFILWTERGIHLYRDYSYTYLLAIFPQIMLELSLSLHGTMVSFMADQENGIQITLVLLYNASMLLIVRFVYSWSLNSVDNKRDAVVNMFPIRIIQDVFQFLFLYSIRNIERAPFWIATALVCLINIMDMTGILNDLYDTMVSKLVSGHQFRRAHNNGAQMNEMMMSQLDSSDMNESNLSFNWLNKSLQGADQTDSVSLLVKAIVSALDLIHQQSYVVLMVSGLLMGLWFTDLYFDSLIPTESKCAIRCSYVAFFRGWQFVLTKQMVIYAQFLLVVSLSVFVWRHRVRRVIEKYPALMTYLSDQPVERQQANNTARTDMTSNLRLQTAPMGLMNRPSSVSTDNLQTSAAQSEASSSNSSSLNFGIGDSTETLTNLNHTASVVRPLPVQPLAHRNNLQPMQHQLSQRRNISHKRSKQQVDEAEELERRRVLRGHISAWWAFPKHLFFFACAMLYTAWALITNSIKNSA